MALVSFVSHVLFGTGFFEALCCCSACFNLRHFYFLLNSMVLFLFHTTAAPGTLSRICSNCLTFFTEKHGHASAFHLRRFLHHCHVCQQFGEIIQHMFT